MSRYGVGEPSETFLNAIITREDIEALEAGGDACMRSNYPEAAVKLYALALRLRSETGIHPLRRASDAR